MQKGQSIVEFALIAPLIVFLFLALVYGGLLFMDYIQYNNAARAIARAAAFSSKTEFDESDKAEFKKKFNPLTSLYTAEISDLQKITDESNTKQSIVTVKIKLTRTQNLKLFKILTLEDSELEFPPQYLNPIIYTMPVENPYKTSN